MYRPGMITSPHRDSNDEPDSCRREMCGRASGDNGDGDVAEVGLSATPFSGTWIDAVGAAGEDRREIYGGGRGFDGSSWVGVLWLAAGPSSASERSSRIARGGGRSTCATSNFRRRNDMSDLFRPFEMKCAAPRSAILLRRTRLPFPLGLTACYLSGRSLPLQLPNSST
jgi:hypothetical protein